MSSESADTISGKRSQELLQQLKQDRTAVQLVLPERNYERLAVISDILTEGGKIFVLIDLPQSFGMEVSNYEKAVTKVEFLGRDRVQHIFSSHIAKVTSTDIWLEFPSSIQRIQRRCFFRIAPPIGTRISFLRMGNLLEAPLINLSEGGALITTQATLKGEHQLMVGENIMDLTLHCTKEYFKEDIKIRKALVLREQTATGSGISSCALQFLEIDSRDKLALQEFVFKCQREILGRQRR